MTAKEYFVDGGCSGNPGPMRIAILTTDKDLYMPQHTDPPYEGTYGDNKIVMDTGEGTNNQAEYIALYAALYYAHSDKANEFVIKSDSKLVVEQVNGNWKVKDQKLKELYDEVQKLLANIRSEKKVSIKWVPREENLAGHMLE